ncbi:hypothetical protein BN946_scf184910.g6 [Trametes cinnabarina]|uniref:Cytochrome P450 n=1 Tax=Pycnoporus cinnabarinus TaxID=5643 RepID=A0A060SAG2_PYCCI|nr:hypothetical protein BN946_scf184910.g6 [Trametes cinnabarina]
MSLSLVSQIPLGIVLAVLAGILWKLRPFLVGQFTSPLLKLKGPRSSSWFYGNLDDKRRSEDTLIYDHWIDKFGHVLSYRGFFNMPRLLTTDTRAINHVLTHSALYQKPVAAQRTLSRLLGNGDQHREQRRVMNPAFGPSQIRELTEIFVEKSMELRDVWAAELEEKGEPTRLNVVRGLSKMTLDVIGLAGFNYEFHALNPNGKPNALAKAFEEIFTFPDKIPVLLILQNFFPVLSVIKDARARRIAHAKEAMKRIGSDLIAQKKAEILRESSGKKNANVGRQSLQGRDLLTLLIKANMATDIPDSQRLSDEDVLAQVPTFLVAGHETTSTATTWCLYALTQYPDVQRKLREELLSADTDTDTPTMDELNALPYLDMVVRESLRLFAPVPESVRVPVKDDIIPLDKPFTDRFGQVHDHITIAKDTAIVVPIKTMNRLKSIWGEDSYEFRPERWENPPDSISSIPGVWAHMLTFLGGPRACIGYRFSIVEMKALIFTLVRAFEFELAVPPSEIKKKDGIVQRPALRGDPSGNPQMPLLVRRYNPTRA